MIERPKIIWFGKAPNDKDYLEAKNRGLVIEFHAGKSNPDFISAREVVFWASPPHFEETISRLDDYCVISYDLGLFIFIVVNSDVQRQEVAEILINRLPHENSDSDKYRVRINPVESYELSNKALTHDPGAAPNDQLEIVGAIDLITKEDLLLLKRAFHDCKLIHLEIIGGGLSGALTFSVAAKLSLTYAGENSKPYFVKLDRPHKLTRELQAYTRYAEHHIDWYLRPNFIPNKCIFGATKAILVGSFVQGSKSLFDEAWAGRGPALIKSLFIETLGLLREDVATPRNIRHTSVVEPLKQFFDYSKISFERTQNAQLYGGNLCTPRELWHKLLDLPSTTWRNSIIHGDMHGENVRVRKDDAIVIDFAHTTEGPSSADLASLEVWFSFKSPPKCTKSFDEWKSLTEKIYDPKGIEESFNVRGLIEYESDWLIGCVMQIRELAKQSVLNLDEYKRVLAVYLLRHASYMSDEKFSINDEKRKSYAYWLANRLVLSLNTNQSKELEVA